VKDVDQARLAAIIDSPSYRLAEEDTEFLKHADLRPVRMQLELLKAELALNRHQIHSTIVVFGGTLVVERQLAQARLSAARVAAAEQPDDPEAARHVARAKRLLAKSHYYDAAREFCRLVSEQGQQDGEREYVVITGGGPGIMEAANRGAFDAGAKTAGLNITLPQEQMPNPYITPGLCFQFHYFALRKMHFLMRAKALVVFPGGFGTLDELFDALTLRQTGRMQALPILLYGRDYWRRVIDFDFLADEGVVADRDLAMFQYVESPQEARDVISRYHEQPPMEF
jgi:uncharacterized protein (TIGR00730 family)